MLTSFLFNQYYFFFLLIFGIFGIFIDTSSNLVPCDTSSVFNSTLNKSDGDRNHDLISLQRTMQQIKTENDNLRQQLNNVKEESDAYRLDLLIFI